LVFDLNDYSSFENIKVWLDSIKSLETREVIKVIFANKCDLENLVPEGEISNKKRRN